MFLRSLLLLFISMPTQMAAATTTDHPEEMNLRPLSFKEMFTETPTTLSKAWERSMNKDAAWTWAGIATSSAVLYYYDEDILSTSEKWGRDLGLGNRDHTKPYITLGKFPIMRGPTDTGSLLYFLGDGWLHIGTALGFYFYGSNTGLTKSTNVGIQMLHGMFASTLINQAMKRSFGRESPNTRTAFRGRWRPFPSIKEYGDHTGEYDAMPSGHIMTATLNFTILINNYPDEAYWLKPLEYTWLSLLGFQMMNNGVHWASDYPLGIATGYLIGNIVSEMGKSNQSLKSNSDQIRWVLWPEADQDRVGLKALVYF